MSCVDKEALCGWKGEYFLWSVVKLGVRSGLNLGMRLVVRLIARSGEIKSEFKAEGNLFGYANKEAPCSRKSEFQLE